MKPTTPTPLALSLAVLFAAGSAFAAGDRIVVLSSDKAVRQQLTDTLCVSQDCVVAEKVLTGGRTDSAKLAREGVTSVVVGRLAKAGAAWSLEVTVQDRSGATRLTRKVPAASDGKVSIVDVVAASTQVISYVEKPQKEKDKQADEEKAVAAKTKSSSKKAALAKKTKAKKAGKKLARAKGTKVGKKLASRTALRNAVASR